MSVVQGPAVALVTGAAGKVGRAVAARLERDGYLVAGLDLEPSSCTLPVIGDVTDREGVRQVAGRVAERLGPISVLVTAAGRHDAAAFGELDDVRWQRLLDVHLGGTVNACAAVLPAMLEAGRGTIVTLTSQLALAGAVGEAYLAAATGAIVGFTRSLSAEVAPAGVRVNCIAVPWTGSGWDPHRPGPEAASDTIAFLLRDGDFYVGQVFIPGGEVVV